MSRKEADTRGSGTVFFLPSELRPGIVEDVFRCLNDLGYLWRSDESLIDFKCYSSKYFRDVVNGSEKAYLELHRSIIDTTDSDFNYTATFEYYVTYQDDIEACERKEQIMDWVSAEEFLELNNYSSPYSAKQFTVGEEFDNVNNLF